MAKQEIKLLNDESFEQEIKQGITLVDFHAEWCGPCRMLAPVLEKVADEVSGKARIVKLNIDNSQQIASTYQVTSIPTLILFKDGQEVNRLVGLRDADTIKEFILSAETVS